MAILAKHYAIALSEKIEESDGSYKDIVDEFIKLLKKHNRLGDVDLIIKHIKSFYQESEEYSVNVDVEYATVNPKEKLLELLSELYDDKDININSKENNGLIAGSKLNMKGFLFDSSVKGHLERFKKQVK